MFDTKTVLAPVELKADEGTLSAVFSTFDVVDQDGDVLVREAFTDGQQVPMVWAHDWSRPIGRGAVHTDAKRAIFDGRFFLDTTAGADAYRTVKAMGELQEYSWGFRILDAEQEVRDEQPVRVITRAEVFEVSPVLVGANRETYTLALKAGLFDPIDLKRRRLSRHQLEAVIATLQALVGEDDAEDDPAPADDAGKAAEPLPEPVTLTGQVEKLAADLDGYLTRLVACTDEDAVRAKDALGGLLRRLSSARIDTDAALKRATMPGDLSPDALKRIFAVWATPAR